jgi:hypothetical protein
MRLQTLLHGPVVAQIFSAKARRIARARLLLLLRAGVTLGEGRDVGCENRNGCHRCNG